MASTDKRTWIAFNGEIYNFRQLRRELAALGRIFRSQGDTEVLLAAYEEWGVDCFSRLEGMWATAIVDLRCNRLVLSRDRFGIKPLFWTVEAGGTLLFASEAKQLIAASRPAKPRANRPLVEMFLRGSRFPVLDETFFDGIHSMPPATWCSIDLAAPRAPRFESYWKLADFTSVGNAISYQDALAYTEELLCAAVRSHRDADVKVGALLSGGLDSSTLLALAHKDGTRLPTYSLGYRKTAPRFCEMHYVDAMTQRDGIENFETTLDAAWVIANTDRALWAIEEPPLAMAAFAQFRLFELCAAHGVTVVLDGQGADEITAGYQYHQRAYLKDQLLRWRPAALVSELRAIARRENRRAARVFAGFFVRERLKARVRHPWAAAANTRTNILEFETAREDRGHDASLVNRQLYYDVRWGNVKIVLGYGDRSAMAHAVESRVPFFDRALVEFMFSLPDTYKIGNGDRKRILRDVARKYVPRAITERADRMGFGTPDEQMIRGPLAGVVADALNDANFLHSGWVVPKEVAKFAREFERCTHNDYRAIWRLFVLSRWANRFSVGE